MLIKKNPEIKKKKKNPQTKQCRPLSIKSKKNPPQNPFLTWKLRKKEGEGDWDWEGEGEWENERERKSYYPRLQKRKN